MDIDEARSEDPSSSVDLSCRGSGPSHLNRRYASVADGDINVLWWTSGTIYYCGVSDQQVVHGLSFPRSDRQKRAMWAYWAMANRCGELA
jgi:hypothetical protein